MTVQSAIEFLQATSEDEALRQELAGIVGVGDGDISSAAELDAAEAEALMGTRGVMVASFADQKGYRFTVAELARVVDVFQRHQSGELSEAEIATALGVDRAGTSKLAAAGSSVGFVYRGARYTAPTSDNDPGNMPQVLQFVQKTSEDEELKEALRAILNVGDGDISNFSEMDAAEANALKSERAATVAEFAARQGYSFTMADLFAVIDAFERVRSGAMSEEAFVKFLRLSSNSSDFFPFIEKVTDMTYKGFHYTTAIPSSAPDNTLQVVRFMEKSDADPELRGQLQAIIGGDGNISDPSQLDEEEAQSLGGERRNQIVALGAAHGYRFTLSDLSAVVGAFQQVQAGKLPIDSCARILGLKAAGAAGDLGTVAQTAGRIYRGVRY